MEVALNSYALPQTLEQVYSLLQPKSVSDVTAITLFLALSTGYALKGKLWDKPDPHHHTWYERPQQQDATSVSQTKTTRNIAQKLEESGKDCVIFWGSQSGTAEGFAARLARECQLRFSVNTLTADLSDYDPEMIALIPETKLAIFILSTYGEGDPSDNTLGFWDWITKARDISLKNVRYAAMGLGNSNYKHYNRVVDVVVERLDDCGAKRLLPAGRANDAERSTEEDFVSWKDDLFRVFRQDLQLAEHAIKYQPTVAVVEDNSLEPIHLHLGKPAHPRDNPRAAAQSSLIKALAIKQSREIFTTGDRNCVHMELDLNEHAELVYKTGDHLAVWPTNPDDEMERLLQVIGLTARKDVPLLLKTLDESRLKVPSPTNLTSLFRSYLEICSPVSRETILGLSAFAPSEASKSYLLQLGQDRDFYTSFISHTHLTFGRLLAFAAPNQIWSSLPLSFLIESIPTMQPRYYSISSSSVLSPRCIAITALVSADSLPNIGPSSTPDTPASIVHGVTTNYLLANHHTSSPSIKDLIKYTLPTASTPAIYVHIRKSKFKLPIAKSTPVIMVAAGTGLAPFRAFIAERAKLAATGQAVGEMVLFFGCRSPDEDFIYKDELETVKRDGKLRLRIVAAFSRAKDEKKVYVQDRVEEEAETVMRLLGEERASLFVCGRTSMAKEVARRVARVAGASGRIENGESWVEGLKRQGKWREDVWG